MTEYRLVLATDKESKAYANAGVLGPLDKDLGYLYRDPLAYEQRRTGGSNYDHIHLSVACAATTNVDQRLVQWWGRGSSGYHYPIGRVMKMTHVKD